MKIPTEIKWGFDPSESDLPVLKNTTARLIWAVIKSNHVVDQYFNDSVLNFANDIIGIRPQNVDGLLKIARQHGLSCFGTTTENAHGQLYPYLIPDMEWWNGLLGVIRGDIIVNNILSSNVKVRGRPLLGDPSSPPG